MCLCLFNKDLDLYLINWLLCMVTILGMHLLNYNIIVFLLYPLHFYWNTLKSKSLVCCCCCLGIYLIFHIYIYYLNYVKCYLGNLLNNYSQGKYILLVRTLHFIFYWIYLFTSWTWTSYDDIWLTRIISLVQHEREKEDLSKN